VGGGTTRPDGGHPVLGLGVRGDIWSGGTAGPPTTVLCLYQPRSASPYCQWHPIHTRLFSSLHW